MSFSSRAVEFIRSCATGLPGEYRFCREGLVSLYASCFAALARHTIGDLDGLGLDERAAWCAYLNSWQDPETGYFLGPELAQDELTRPEMDETYVRMHLAVHVLPTLETLGGTPAHPLRFARRFSDPGALRGWLDARDWRQAWLEGNNLLFAGQLLVHLRDQEREPSAQPALDLYFDWLDAQQDPATGLWGTGGHCDLNEALYGGYHQLLVYFYCGRPVRFADKIIDGVLSLQHGDGSFSRTPGGGAFEDVDAVHVLVNLAQRTGYRLVDVRRALGLAMGHILRQQAPDGGFVYRWGRSYMQSGLLRTFVPSDTSDLFSTWFRLHTLAVISEVLDEPALRQVPWRFNQACSMGWHASACAAPSTPAASTRGAPAPTKTVRRPSLLRRAMAKLGRAAMARIPADRARAWAASFVRLYGQAHSPDDRLRLLAGLDADLDRLGCAAARALGDGLDVRFWGTQICYVIRPHLRPGMQILHLGCGTGSVSFSLASSGGVRVTATDRDQRLVAEAAMHYHHQNLSFVPARELTPTASHPDLVLCTDLVEGRPAWDAWSAVWGQHDGGKVLAQLTPSPASWRQVTLHQTPSAAQGIAGQVPAGWEIVRVETRLAVTYACLRVVLIR